MAGDHAAYFDGLSPSDLAQAVRDWLVLYREGTYPKSADMPWLTWAESAELMLREIPKGS